MDWQSFAIGALCGAGTVLAVGVVSLTVWLLRSGRDEWQKLTKMVSLRRDLQDEAHRLVDDIDALERRRKELQLKTPPRIPSLTEVKKDRGIG